MFASEQPSDFLNLEDSQLFARLTPKAVKVIQLAQKETRRLKHSFVGTEQLLLALIEEGDGIAAQALKLAGVQLKTTCIEVEKIIGRGNGNISVGIPFTLRAKLAIACGVESANDLGHDYSMVACILKGFCDGTISSAIHSTFLATFDCLHHSAAPYLDSHLAPVSWLTKHSLTSIEE